MRVTHLILAVLFLSSTTVFSQRGNYLKLSHKITTEEKNITNFTKIDAEEDFEIIIEIGQKESVQIEANENLHDYILVEKAGNNTLKLRLKNYSTWSNNRKNDGARERLTAYVTMKDLTTITASEDVTIELLDKLRTDNLTFDMDEDCTFDGEIEVNNLVANLDEDSQLNLKGSASTFELEAEEDSYVKGYKFVVGDLNVELGGDSEAKLTVNGNINLRARGDSNFYYKGNGTIIKQRLTGDSEVKYWE